MFSCCTMPFNSKETKLGSSNHEASPSAGENKRAVLEPCPTCACVHIAISSDVDIPKAPWFNLL